MDKILVTRPSVPSFEEYSEEIKRCFDIKWFTNMGEKHQILEDALKDFLKIPNITLFANGHLALENAIAELDLPKGSEVITTPFTFASTTHAIVRNGLVPVFCDIREDDYTIDASKIEALITPMTKAIVPVHVYGNICDDDAISAIAKKHNLKVIYDAAHAFGVEKNGVSVLLYGDASALSFHATKVFNTVEGGAICYKDSSREVRYNDMKNFGIHDEETVSFSGGNAKMNEFSAAMGICNLRHFNEECLKRKNVFEHYVKRLSDIDGIKILEIKSDTKSNYSYFPVVVDGVKFNRDNIKAKLHENNIESRKYFYPLTCDFDCYIGNSYKGSDNIPVARRISQNVLALPLYADLMLEDVDRICDLILAGGK